MIELHQFLDHFDRCCQVPVRVLPPVSSRPVIRQHLVINVVLYKAFLYQQSRFLSWYVDEIRLSSPSSRCAPQGDFPTEKLKNKPSDPPLLSLAKH
ncbi:MAG: hypothetical protein ACFFD4_05775 [Candidatus Odinarchaeota archaeon]